MKKVLFVATVVQKHINVFHLPALKMLQEDGYRTYVAAANDTDSKHVKISYCDEYVEIVFKRSPLHPGNVSAYRKLKDLIQSNDFDIIHCHTPVGGLLTRLAARKVRKKGTRVFYTAHGFHFYKGAPLKNWLFYYPVEKICSYFTDVLITINQEDYELAKNKFKAKAVHYVPGVGIDLSRFENIKVDRNVKRREIGVPEDAVLLLSVGELNENKNHHVIIRALAKLNNPKIHYAIAGIGNKRDYLFELAKRLGVSDQVHLLGFRKDIPELNYVSDIFCFPSIREGLPVSLMEAAALGLPMVAADNRGTREIIKNGKSGFLFKYGSVNDFADGINILVNSKEVCDGYSEMAKSLVYKFSVENVLFALRDLYSSLN